VKNRTNGCVAFLSILAFVPGVGLQAQTGDSDGQWSPGLALLIRCSENFLRSNLSLKADSEVALFDEVQFPLTVPISSTEGQKMIMNFLMQLLHAAKSIWGA
jgi:hypothetical protein